MRRHRAASSRLSRSGRAAPTALSFRSRPRGRDLQAMERALGIALGDDAAGEHRSDPGKRCRSAVLARLICSGASALAAVAARGAGRRSVGRLSRVVRWRAWSRSWRAPAPVTMFERQVRPIRMRPATSATRIHSAPLARVHDDSRFREERAGRNGSSIEDADANAPPQAAAAAARRDRSRRSHRSSSSCSRRRNPARCRTRMSSMTSPQALGAIGGPVTNGRSVSSRQVEMPRRPDRRRACCGRGRRSKRAWTSGSPAGSASISGNQASVVAPRP